MLLDQQLLFTAAGGDTFTATGNSSNVLDLVGAISLGAGERLQLVNTFLAVTSNATLVTTLVGADNAAMSTNPINVVVSATITPTVGTQQILAIPPHKLKEFYRLTYTLAGGASPSITVQSELVKDAQTAWPVAFINY